MKTRTYSLVIEGEEGSYSAYVPELPAILIAARSMEELTPSAQEAIRLYLEETGAERSPASTLCEIDVEVPV